MQSTVSSYCDEDIDDSPDDSENFETTDLIWKYICTILKTKSVLIVLTNIEDYL